jgi:uncharacterized protein DUF4386
MMGPASGSIQRYARIAGVLFLISFVAGGFGEFFVPNQLIVGTDATATASNIVASTSLYRWSFAAYLVEALCDISLTLVLYVLLRPVHRELALLAVFFRLLATATFAFTELFYFGALFILGGAAYLNTFSPEQLQTLALLSLKFYGIGSGLFLAFYGVPSVLLGYLMYRSGYLPKLAGGLMALSGLGFIAQNIAVVLAPSYASFVFLVPVPLAGVFIAVWLLVRGVDLPKWHTTIALAEQRSASV